MKSTFRVVVSLTLAAVLAVAGKGESADLQLQEASYQEETVGDLGAAIEIYEEIISAAEASRPHLARAYYRLAACYLKKGEQDKAAEALRKLVEQFPEQKEVVARARARLANLGSAGDGMRIRRVWSDAKDDMGSASPDGKYISFVDWDTGDLAVHETVSGKDRRLTKNGSWSESPEFAEWSIFSPDGRQLVYSWYKDGSHGLQIVGLDASEPRVLFRSEDAEVVYPQPFGWSPDGKHVLAVFSRRGRSVQIVFVTVADGSVQVLKTLERSRPRTVSLSPDGQHLAYDCSQNEDSTERDIFVLKIGENDVDRLADHPADDRLLGWSPDGRVLFTSERRGVTDAWMVHVENGQRVGEPELVKTSVRGMQPMGFARDGSFYYGVRASTTDVFVAGLDLEAGKLVDPPVRITRRMLGGNNVPSPDWSSDGQFLAFAAGVRDGNATITIHSLETGQQRTLSVPHPTDATYSTDEEREAKRRLMSRGFGEFRPKVAKLKRLNCR